MDESPLAAIPLFASLSRRERREVARHADQLDVPEGEVLVREGRFSYEFFVLQRGTAKVLRDDEPIADLGPGDFLGEMGALADARRNASVVTTSAATVIVMTAPALRALARELPAMGERLRAAVEERSERLGR